MFEIDSRAVLKVLALSQNEHSSHVISLPHDDREDQSTILKSHFKVNESVDSMKVSPMEFAVAAC